VGIPELEPDTAARCGISLVHFFGGPGVQFTDGTGDLDRGGGEDGDEVVVIWEDGPGLEVPVVVLCQVEEGVAEELETAGGAEVGEFLVRGGCDYVGAWGGEVVGGGVRPGGHVVTIGFCY